MANSLVPFLATREAVALLANDLIMLGTSIRSFRHLEHQNPSIISEDIGRARIEQQFRFNFRFYRQSQDVATIPEEEDRIGGVGIQLS